ncbi:hypothetical protein FD755_008781, partial [Muntiacus reevesi]
PWRIIDDCGGAFTMGVIGGGVFQAIKGFRNAPGAVLAARSGPLAMVGSAMMGGILLFHNAPPFLEDPGQLPPKEGTPGPGYPSYQQYH